MRKNANVMSGCMILYFLFSFFQNKYFIHLLSNRTKNYNSAYNSTLCKIGTLTLVIKRNGRNCNVRQNEQQTKKTSRPQNVILLLVQQHRTDAFPLKFILLAVLVCFSKYYHVFTVLLTQSMFFPPATGFAVLYHVVHCCVVIC